MPRFRKRFANSDPGLVRHHNEDAGFAGSSLLVVADGVGGAAAGEVASASAANVVAWFAMRPGLVTDPAEALRQAIEAAYAHLRHGVAADAGRAGMATTLTAVLSTADQCVLAHVGDSRCYLHRRGQPLRQLTRDDTWVQHLIDSGAIAAHERRSHPYRSLVVNSINAEGPADPTIVQLDVRAGDRLLLCSDGLTDVVSDEVIAMSLSVASPRLATRYLVNAALAAGGPDNVTCVVGDVEDGEPLSPAGQMVGSLRSPQANLIDPAATFAPSV